MKRYLYILLIAVATFVACKPTVEPKEPIVDYHFGDIETTTTENSATITAVKPYITIDDVVEANTTIYLEYWAEGEESLLCKAGEYSESDGMVTFVVESLTPNTSYNAHVAISGQHGIKSSDVVSFKTLEHIPVVEYSCECSVDAKGVLAYVTLDNVAVKLDGVESKIAKVEFKYSQSLVDSQWTTMEVSAEQLANGFRIPAEGKKYLREESAYNYTVTLYPEDATIESYTINGDFTTIQARLSSEDLASPTITTAEDGITLSCVKPTLLIDGVEIPGYAEVIYLFYYTNGNSDDLDYGTIEAVCADGTLSASVPFSQFREGEEYEFYCRMDIDDTYVMDSYSTLYTMPEAEIPTPPAPPVTGDADTSVLAGDWHLTKWRGAEPAFDVYLSITEDGVVSLYQRIASRLWETFYSTVGYENGVIDGVYTDGVAWAHSYNVAVEGGTMTWTSTTDSSDVSVYTRSEELPDVTNPEIRTMSVGGKRFL